MSNILGNFLRLTSYGESHGHSIGGILDNFPANIPIDLDFIQDQLEKRRPGASSIATSRKESDRIQILSGVFEGKSTGASIAFMVENQDARSKDYNEMEKLFRPNHADYGTWAKYGIRDHRGGGRSSARTTISLVVAGAFARLFLKEVTNMEFLAYVKSVGDIRDPGDYENGDYPELEKQAYTNDVRMISEEHAALSRRKIEQSRSAGDSVGGRIQLLVKNVPAGLGNPVFLKYDAYLAFAMMNIPAVRYVSMGNGIQAPEENGSSFNDIFEVMDGKPRTRTNHSGGVQGGITNGMPITMEIGFKPVPTIMKEQPTIDTSLEPGVIKGKGRHDPCVVPRAVPIVANTAAFVTADFYLMNRLARKD